MMDIERRYGTGWEEGSGANGGGGQEEGCKDLGCRGQEGEWGYGRDRGGDCERDQIAYELLLGMLVLFSVVD